MKLPLTLTEQSMLDFIRSQAVPPTVRELCERLGLTNGSAHRGLRELERKGWIARVPGKARAIWIVDGQT